MPPMRTTDLAGGERMSDIIIIAIDSTSILYLVAGAIFVGIIWLLVKLTWEVV